MEMQQISGAGVATARKMISKNGTIHTDAEFIKTLTVNTIGSFQVARLAAERMKDRSPDDDDEKNGLRGCIIQTASIAAFEGQMGQVAYAASKGAVVGKCVVVGGAGCGPAVRVMIVASKRPCRFSHF
jgi:3-hydroxyacyl-CoA dehydrogenase / 3-hydroxy-2-methylbutyryl-CoA dehydrogenase